MCAEGSALSSWIACILKISSFEDRNAWSLDRWTERGVEEERYRTHTLSEKCQAAQNQSHQSVQERASQITCWRILCSEKRRLGKLLMLQPPACDFHNRSTHHITETKTAHMRNPPEIHVWSGCLALRVSCGKFVRMCSDVWHWLARSECSCHGDGDSPLPADFGDLESEIDRVVAGRLPLQDVITSTRLIFLQGKPQTQTNSLYDINQTMQWGKKHHSFIIYKEN